METCCPHCKGNGKVHANFAAYELLKQLRISQYCSVTSLARLMDNDEGLIRSLENGQLRLTPQKTIQYIQSIWKFNQRHLQPLSIEVNPLLYVAMIGVKNFSVLGYLGYNNRADLLNNHCSNDYRNARHFEPAKPNQPPAFWHLLGLDKNGAEYVIGDWSAENTCLQAKAFFQIAHQICSFYTIPVIKVFLNEAIYSNKLLVA